MIKKWRLEQDKRRRKNSRKCRVTSQGCVEGTWRECGSEEGRMRGERYFIEDSG